jgi:hypothetical protein
VFPGDITLLFVSSQGPILTLWSPFFPPSMEFQTPLEVPNKFNGSNKYPPILNFHLLISFKVFIMLFLSSRRSFSMLDWLDSDALVNISNKSPRIFPGDYYKLETIKIVLSLHLISCFVDLRASFGLCDLELCKIEME